MRVLILSQYYPPEEVPIPYSLAQHLASAGHQVRVLTGFPNYPYGEVFPGYRQRWRLRSTHDGIDLLRVPLWMDHSLSPLKRILNYGSFAISAASAWSFARDADVIYIYATQMTPALGPWLWRRLGGAPYVLHVQDLWPDSILGSSLVRQGLVTSLLQRALTHWLKSVYNRSSAVIGIAPTMVQSLRDRGVPPEKLHLQYNWATEDVPSTSARLPGSPSVSILYAGNIGDMQDLETAIRAAHRVAGLGLHLTLLGDGVALSRLKTLAAELGCTNVDFAGRVPRSAMGPFYARSDFSLVTLKDLPHFRGTIPSKLQSSFAQGLPVITTVQGDVRKIVSELGVGFTADAQSVDSLAEAFRQAATATLDERKTLQARALKVYTERFSRVAGVSGVTKILMDVTRPPRD